MNTELIHWNILSPQISFLYAHNAISILNKLLLQGNIQCIHFVLTLVPPKDKD